MFMQSEATRISGTASTGSFSITAAAKRSSDARSAGSLEFGQRGVQLFRASAISAPPLAVAAATDVVLPPTATLVIMDIRMYAWRNATACAGGVRSER